MNSKLSGFLAVFIVLGFFILVIIVAFTNMDTSDHDILYLLLGQFSSGFLYVIGYFFGSALPVKGFLPEKPPTGDKEVS